MPLADACRKDPAFRARADEDVKSILAERDLQLPPHVDVRIAENTAEVFHVVMPPGPNVALSDETLGVVAGGTPGVSYVVSRDTPFGPGTQPATAPPVRDPRGRS